MGGARERGGWGGEAGKEEGQAATRAGARGVEGWGFRVKFGSRSLKRVAGRNCQPSPRAGFSEKFKNTGYLRIQLAVYSRTEGSDTTTTTKKTYVHTQIQERQMGTPSLIRTKQREDEVQPPHPVHADKLAIGVCALISRECGFRHVGSLCLLLT